MSQLREGKMSRYRALGRRHLDRIPQLEAIDSDQRVTLEAVSAVLPFRVNQYVIDELIDWDDIPHDPIYQLTFPQAGMLATEDLARMRELVWRDAPEDEIRRAAREIQTDMNPHPAGQKDLNVPVIEGEKLAGSQHKYRETMLFFPSQGQTCHAYCTYCFRWAQFVGIDGFKFANHEASKLVEYLGDHHEVSDVLFTGGDPLVMGTKVLRRYIEPLLEPGMEHVRSIRIGTKALSYWPFRFLTDRDADDLLRLFEEVRAAGRHLALMGHFSHPRELETEAAQRAIARVLATGAVIRGQAPVVRHVNDSAEVWGTLWQRLVELGGVPYYMFIARDTGPMEYFKISLLRALEIFNRAYGSVSGLARTVRGPSMSATPGKVLIDGLTEINGERVFVLKFIQGRDPSWVGRIFFAKCSRSAAWLDDLEPEFGEDEFFFEPYLRQLKRGVWEPEWEEQAASSEEPVHVEAG